VITRSRGARPTIARSRGFTLLELFIIVVILAITMAFAAPGVTTMLANERITTGVNDFVAALQFAKTEAATRLNPVTICKRNAAGSDCVAGGDWSAGWIVFSDVDGDASVDGGETVLLTHEALNANISFGGTAGVTTSITYQPSGTTSITNTEVLIMCDARGFGDSARGVLVTITGRGNTMKASDSGQNSCL
jgi:type IV fimbrial biogenesis protein FimT